MFSFFKKKKVTTNTIQDNTPNQVVQNLANKFLEYVKNNPLPVVCATDTIVQAQGKIKQQNKIIDLVSGITTDVEYETLCKLLKKSDIIYEYNIVREYSDALGNNWYEIFWSYVKSKTSEDLYDDYKISTRNIGRISDTTSFNPRLEKEHGVTLTQVIGKVSGSISYVVKII
jgi:hypothetical protein